jgi:hypothetical protein
VATQAAFLLCSSIFGAGNHFGLDGLWVHALGIEQSGVADLSG